jgi:hypothetical protein
MTHWLVYVHNAVKAFKNAFDVIFVQLYKKNPRVFLEAIASCFIWLGVVVWLLFNVAFPFPSVAPVAANAPPSAVFDDFKPLLLHAFAAMGMAASLLYMPRLFTYYLDSIVSLTLWFRKQIIKTTNGRGINP